MSQYIYDKNEFRFKKARTSVWAVIRKILMFFVGTLSMAVLYYVIFALVFSTEEERRLRQENRLFEEETALTNILAVNDNVTEEAAKSPNCPIIPHKAPIKK